jgi:hypothetical protein
LEVPLKCGLGGDGAPIRAALIESLIKYLLFVRSQLPKRYEELAADAAQADAPSKRGNALAIQRRGRCLGSAENLFDAVRALMRDTPPDMAAVVIGHSATLPKEVYVFRFAVADGDAAAAVAAELEPAAARDSARRVLRKLVTEVEAQFEGVRRPMKTWLFVHQREADGEGDERAVCAPGLPRGAEQVLPRGDHRHWRAGRVRSAPRRLAGRCPRRAEKGAAEASRRPIRGGRSSWSVAASERRAVRRRRAQVGRRF